MRTYQFDGGGHNMLTVVHDNDKVLVIGEGYVTVWNTFEDFERQLDGEGVFPVDEFKY